MNRKLEWDNITRFQSKGLLLQKSEYLYYEAVGHLSKLVPKNISKNRLKYSSSEGNAEIRTRSDRKSRDWDWN